MRNARKMVQNDVEVIVPVSLAKRGTPGSAEMMPRISSGQMTASSATKRTPSVPKASGCLLALQRKQRNPRETLSVRGGHGGCQAQGHMARAFEAVVPRTARAPPSVSPGGLPNGTRPGKVWAAHPACTRRAGWTADAPCHELAEAGIVLDPDLAGPTIPAVALVVTSDVDHRAEEAAVHGADDPAACRVDGEVPHHGQREVLGLGGPRGHRPSGSQWVTVSRCRAGRLLRG